MNFLSKTIISGLVFAMLASCNVFAAKSITPSNNIISKEVKTDVITGITLSMNANVVYNQGPVTSLKMKGPDNVIENTIINNKGGMIEIKLANDAKITGNFKKSTFMIYVTSPKISNMIINGAGEIYVPEHISTSSLCITVNGAGDISTKGITADNDINAIVNGAGDIEMDFTNTASSISATVTGAGDIECEKLTVNEAKFIVSGAGDIEVKGGNAKTASITVSGAGDVNARHMPTSTVNAVVSGTGDILCNATTLLNATIIGSGDIRYAGNAKVNCATRNKPSQIGF